MSNLIINYLHRDEGNFKDHLRIVIMNPAGYTPEKAERMIRKLLIDGEYFYPEKLGLPVSDFARNNDWHEFDSVDTNYEATPLAVTFETLLEKLEASNKAFLKPIKVHKVPAIIPVRLAVSWLEILRQMRETLEAIIALVRKDSVVVVFKNDEDWNLIEETLRLDSESGNFDNDLRKSIERALNRAKEIPDLWKKVKLLRWKTLWLARYGKAAK